MICQPSRPGSETSRIDQGRVVARRTVAGHRGRSRRRRSRSRPGPSTARRRAAKSGSSSTIRIVSATRDRLRRRSRRLSRRARPRPGSSGRSKVTRVPGRPSGRSSSRSRPPCASTSRREMNSPRPVPGDARLADVPGAVERLGDERPLGIRDPDALVVDGHDQPLAGDLRGDRHEPVRRPVLEGVADEVLEDLTDARRHRPRSAGRSSGSDDDQSIGATAGLEVAPQPRHERREQDRRALQDQRIGLQVGHVEDLPDERRQAVGHLVDALDVGALLSRRRGRGGAASRHSRG